MLSISGPGTTLRWDLPGHSGSGPPQGAAPCPQQVGFKGSEALQPRAPVCERDSEQAGRPPQPCSHHASVRATASLREGLTLRRAHTLSCLILMAALRVGAFITAILHQNHPPFRAEKSGAACPGSQDGCPGRDRNCTVGAGLRSLCRTQPCIAHARRGGEGLQGAAPGSSGPLSACGVWDMKGLAPRQGQRGTQAPPAEPEDKKGRGGGGYSQWGQGHALKPCSGRIRKDLVLKHHCVW